MQPSIIPPSPAPEDSLRHRSCSLTPPAMYSSLVSAALLGQIVSLVSSTPTAGGDLISEALSASVCLP